MPKTKMKVQPKVSSKSVVIHFDGLDPDCANALASNQSGKLFLFRSDDFGEIPPKTKFHRVTRWGARRWFNIVCAIARMSPKTIGFEGDPGELFA